MTMKLLERFFFGAPKIYKITALMSMVGGILTITNFLISGNIFWLLSFYFPILWLLWLGCVFCIQMERRPLRLGCLWLLIDFVILLFLVSSQFNDPGWFRSQGVEMILVLIFFPVIIPIILVIATLPNNIGYFFSHAFDWIGNFFGGGLGEAVSSWLSLSFLGMVQAIIFYLLLSFVLIKKKVASL